MYQTISVYERQYKNQPKYMEKELWHSVQHYEGYYEVSNHGRVRSLHGKKKGKFENVYDKKGKVLKQRIGRLGYAYVILCVESIRKTKKVHRLVADAFCNKSAGANVVNHLDGKKTNNYYKNLEWTDNHGNMEHAVKHGLILRGSQAPGALLSETLVFDMRKMFKDGSTQKAIGLKYNLNRHRVYDIVRNRIWKHVII